PSLKERREDIPLLVDHIIAKFNKLQGRNIIGVSDEVMRILMGYDFPGNVRELENIIEHAFVLCRKDVIEVNHLPPELIPDQALSDTLMDKKTIIDMEKQLIYETLNRLNGNRKLTARELGIDISTLYRKIKKFNIHVPERDGRGRRNL
ncbi:MAG TPA: helix-turn-helix domain-containing protein, partial [Syntrophorhabdaceae bacterium]|nr:helix-turn-helix domain-containing protein [Syntrophorhabdaceae bacterium]